MGKDTLKKTGLLVLFIAVLLFIAVHGLHSGYLTAPPRLSETGAQQVAAHESEPVGFFSADTVDIGEQTEGAADYGSGGSGSGHHARKALKAPTHPPYVADEVLVQFSPKISRDEILGLLNGSGITIQQVLSSGNLVRLKLPPSLCVDDALEMFRDIPEVVFSEPNFLVRTSGVPNDPSFDKQWALDNGGGQGGMADADIDAVEAWDKNVGSASVVVAVVDEGIDFNHPDLSQNIRVNTDEIPGNGIDDDQNGFVDDVHGWDFYHDDNTVFDDAAEDRHGTEVAGIIGAVGNNGIGTAGICWTVSILPVKFIANGSGTVADAVLALNYAVNEGADIINCSWGGSFYSVALEAAFQDVRSAGVLVVTSAGNSGMDTDVNSHYPSNYSMDNILSVAATDNKDELSSFSNYGVTTVDLGAPGSALYTTVPGGKYAYFSGTSASAPVVSGAAALALSTEPNQTYLDLKDGVMNSVDAVPDLTQKTVSGGRVNVYNLTAILGPADSDGDGLPDTFEVAYGLNPADATDARTDPDGDGLDNLLEFFYGTEPDNADTDGDGLDDGFEVGYSLDPGSAADGSSDLDGDGLTNVVEYAAQTRIDNGDTDGDGIDDFTEYGSAQHAVDTDRDGAIDALDDDADNDGKPDAQEGVADADNDGLPNYVDVNDSDGPLGDQDGDGLINSVEATFMLNANLIDSDGDGIDDRTEFGPGSIPRDSDGDNVADALDADADGDGKSDLDEGVADDDQDGVPNYRDGDDRDGPTGDSDSDGLLNATEASYGLNVNLSDSDGDGLGDFSEFQNGADFDHDGLIDALDPDSDDDGAPDMFEGNLDGNGDTIPDRLDSTVATLLTDYGSLSLILPGVSGEFEQVRFIAQPVAESVLPDLDFRYGGFQYKVTGVGIGGSVSIMVQTSFALPPNAEFWKGDGQNGFYKYPAVIQGNSLQFTLTDGDSGDDDGLTDGVIVDPGYIAVPVVSNSGPVSGGGGGGSGCSLSTVRSGFSRGAADLILLMSPLILLSGAVRRAKHFFSG
jgi:subtilisin family serine protease